jgi:hypothetical protein
MMRGGTRVVLLYNSGRNRVGRLATTDDNEIISSKFLENIDSVSTVSTSSLCSMILKGALKVGSSIEIRSQDMTNRLIHTPNVGVSINTVCMKFTLVRPDNSQQLPIQWTDSNAKVINKLVLTENECNTEIETQRTMYQDLLCGDNPRELIPDALASILLSSHEIESFISRVKYLENSHKVVLWLKNAALKYKLKIHIMFMDFLEGYKTVDEYYDEYSADLKSLEIKQDDQEQEGDEQEQEEDGQEQEGEEHEQEQEEDGEEREQELNEHEETTELQKKINDRREQLIQQYNLVVTDAGYILVMIVLMTAGIPWDLHRKNILVNSETRKTKCVDLGRIIFLNGYFTYNFDVFSKNHGPLCAAFFIKDSFSNHLSRVDDYSKKKYEFHSLVDDEKTKRVYEILVFVAFIDVIMNYHFNNRITMKCFWILCELFNFSCDLGVESFFKTFPSSYTNLSEELKTTLNFEYIAETVGQSIGLCKIPQLTRGESFRPPNKAARDAAEATAAYDAEVLSISAKEENPPPHLDHSEINKFYESLSLKFYPLDWTKLTPPNTEDIEDDAALKAATSQRNADFDRSVSLALSNRTHFMIGTRTDPDFTFGHMLMYRKYMNKFEYYDEKKYKPIFIDVSVSVPRVYVASENNSLADTTKQYLRMSLQAIEGKGFLYIEVDEYGRVLDKTKHEETSDMLASGYPRESSFDRIFDLFIKHSSSPENLKKCTDVCEHIVKNSSRCSKMKRALKVSEGGSRKRIIKYFKKSKSKSKFNRKFKSKSKSKTKRRHKK